MRKWLSCVRIAQCACTPSMGRTTAPASRPLGVTWLTCRELQVRLAPPAPLDQRCCPAAVEGSCLGVLSLHACRPCAAHLCDTSGERHVLGGVCVHNVAAQHNTQSLLC